MALLALSASCADDEPDPTRAIYDQSTGRVLVQLPAELADGRTMTVQVRRGNFGVLDCATQAASFTPLTTHDDELRYFGPPVDQSLLQPFFGPEWAYEPTPEMLAALEQGTDSIIDVCIMEGATVVEQIEADLFQAWDEGRSQGLGGKADDASTGEQRITSAQKYGERCVGELGEIPFFEKLGDGRYSTYNCLDSTPIPMTVTQANGTVKQPEGEVAQCDKPQYIYSLCEQGPRVASRINEQGTRWVLLCRKSIGGLTSDQYNDIAMIGNNPFTGKTCYFQNALYQKKDGGNVPHPADKEKSTNLWSGVHGALGSGIQCTDCHDADPFIHSPWIDGAKDANGRSIVPKMGEDPDYAIGANDTPYSIVNLKGQGWRMHRQVTSPETAACTQCHRLGEGKWVDWAPRLDGTDSAFANKTTPAYLEFANLHWMPTSLGDLTEANWEASPYGKALAAYKKCQTAPASCDLKEIPSVAAGTTGGNGQLRNPVSLSDAELASQSVGLIADGNCAGCHAMSQGGYNRFLGLNEEAEADCFAGLGGGTETEVKVRLQNIGKDAMKFYGPYEVGFGGTFKVEMTGEGDPDLYVRKFEQVSKDAYDCRPYKRSPDETCGADQFSNYGPGKFYVGVRGNAAGSRFRLKINYTKPSSGQKKPADVINCMRLDSDSASAPFVPHKMGIYSAAAHLPWFGDLFHAAYPPGESGNTGNTWIIEYAKFKNRMSMPKGNNTRWTQAQFDVVAEWFARGLPNLGTHVQPDDAPESCTPSITSAVGTHVSQMATTGWRRVNADAGMAMFGCSGQQTGSACLTSLPRASSKPYGAGWEAQSGATLRILREFNFKTYYWMRSSADGRFIGNGAQTDAGGMISDLQENKDIPVSAAYDPGFFPDNRTWLFQGTPIGAAVCQMSLLTGKPNSVAFNEPACSAAGNVGLYQHLGQGLGNGDYFAINSQFTSDNGGDGPDEEPTADFAADSQMTFIPLVFNGTGYVEKDPVSVDAPFEGDSVISPSTKLVVSRIAGAGGEQQGYALRRITLTPSGSQYSVSATPIATYCERGAKPSISFDERFMVIHHYVDAGDYADLGASAAEQAEYASKGSSNLYVIDLVTGTKTRVTKMKPGQFALFPHFRSDNWIYFLVRDANTDKEYAVASDAALVLE
ncbi:MAG: PPC domain-containing protein [Kofleriaceae bacterium]